MADDDRRGNIDLRAGLAPKAIMASELWGGTLDMRTAETVRGSSVTGAGSIRLIAASGRLDAGGRAATCVAALGDLARTLFSAGQLLLVDWSCSGRLIQGRPARGASG